jgi:hypothetical protein
VKVVANDEQESAEAEITDVSMELMEGCWIQSCERCTGVLMVLRYPVASLVLG